MTASPDRIAAGRRRWWLPMVLMLVLSACGVTRESVAGASPMGEIDWPDGDSAELPDYEPVVAELLASELFSSVTLAGAADGDVRAVVARLGVIEAAQEKVLGDEGATVSDEVLADAREAAPAQFAVDFPDEGDFDTAVAEVPLLIDLLARLEANDVALIEAFADSPEAALPCVRHILVEDEAVAEALLADIEGGGDFATIAMENSIDTGSGAAGGELGCVPTTQWVPEFGEAVESAEIGELVGPVESQFGFHLIEVTGVEQDGSAPASAAVQEALTTAEVDLDPAVGTWDPVQGRVVPPTEG